jgi:hypothetical protein
MNMRSRTILAFMAGMVLVLTFSACATWKSTFSPPKFVVTPDKTVLSPALIKKPIAFSGSGWKPNEMVVVDLVLPPGVKVKGVKEGEDVGIAFANADAKGQFKAKMGAMATLNWFFQVGWTPLLKPDFKKARPLRPGVYTIKASGMDSELEAKATLTLLPPPKKKK